MARKASPWFWDQLQEWCVTVDGTRHRLGKNPDGCSKPTKNAKGKWVVPKAIDDAFTDLKKRVKDKVAASDSVKAIFDLFLDWTKTHRAHETYIWYRKHLQSFADTLKPQTLTVDKLRAYHVDSWIDGHGWDGSYARGAMTAVARALNWALKKGRIEFNPIHRKLDKPAAAKREVVIEQADYQKLRKLASSEFCDLIDTAWETGCRPQEVTKVEARHVDVKNGRWVFPVSESKGKKKKRIVYLSPRALAITKRLMKQCPEGPLYRRPNGEPWTRHDVSQHFQRLEKHVGTTYRLYDFRHTFITTGLKNGVDPVTMANLVGHVDLKMIHAIYSHVSQDTKFMQQAAKRATAGASA
jgi:integrase